MKKDGIVVKSLGYQPLIGAVQYLLEIATETIAEGGNSEYAFRTMGYKICQRLEDAMVEEMLPVARRRLHQDFPLTDPAMREIVDRALARVQDELASDIKTRWNEIMLGGDQR